MLCSAASPPVATCKPATAALQRFNMADAGDSLGWGIGAIGYTQQPTADKMSFPEANK